MKSYNHLFEKYIDPDNYRVAVHNATRRKNGKRKKRERAKRFRENSEKNMPELLALAANFHNEKHTPRTIYDGISRKQRTIIIPSMREQVIHHMAINVLKPVILGSMYEYSCGSLPGRGPHKARKRIERWIRHDPKHCKYVLQMDIRKFFDSIPHDKLKAMIASKIHDEKFLRVLFEIIDVQPVGLPLGFYTSQWLANWYLQGLDHFIKEKLGAAHYVRYMDDMVVFGSNKRELHRMKDEIERYLRENLGLRLKSNWQVFRLEYTRAGKTRGRRLDFMGFQFWRHWVTLRRNIMLKATRKARRISKKPVTTIHDCRQMMAYLGWIDCTDTYNMYQKWIKPFVSFRAMRRRESKFDRRQKLCGFTQKTAAA